MLRGLQKLKYYFLLVGETLRIIIFLVVLSLLLTVLSGIELSVRNVTLLLTLNYEPKNVLEAFAQIVILFAELTPIMAFVETKSFSREERAELKASLMKDHIVVVGCGHLGEKVVSLLEDLSIPYVLIVLPEDKLRNETVIRLLKRGRPIVFGDATVTDVLLKASVDKAKAIIIAINDDTTNTVIAEKAKRINPRIRTVVRIFNDELASVLSKNPSFDEILSTTGISRSLFVFGALFDVAVEEDLLAIRVRSELAGRRIREIETLGVSVVAVKREGLWMKFTKDTAIKEGDVIVIVGPKESLRNLINKFCFSKS